LGLLWPDYEDLTLAVLDDDIVALVVDLDGIPVFFGRAYRSLGGS